MIEFLKAEEQIFTKIGYHFYNKHPRKTRLWIVDFVQIRKILPDFYLELIQIWVFFIFFPFNAYLQIPNVHLKNPNARHQICSLRTMLHIYMCFMFIWFFMFTNLS